MNNKTLRDSGNYFMDRVVNRASGVRAKRVRPLCGKLQITFIAGGSLDRRVA